VLLLVVLSLPQIGRAIPLWNDSVRQLPGEAAAEAETASLPPSLENQTDMPAASKRSRRRTSSVCHHALAICAKNLSTAIRQPVPT
jgi:hypothetical protein